jgi:hypothetical protein
MIFDISPSQIQGLDSNQLVELLRKLLYSEAQRFGLSLRGVLAPLQITVADGGEDARVSWEAGIEKTDYFPSRFCIFQSKATDPKPGGWKKEVWTKSTQKLSQPELNEAVEKAIALRGSYIGFTSAALTGDKYDSRVKGIRQGIQDAGSDPNLLTAIDIYDANKIADWVSQYPAIAAWINEKQSGLSLKSFQTIARWGSKSDIASIAQISDTADRFQIDQDEASQQLVSRTLNSNALVFEKAKDRIVDHLAVAGRFVRVLGLSGVGKTRFVYEVLRDESSTAKIALATSAIYCDLREIGNQIFQIAEALASERKSALVIVDECPRETALKLCDTVGAEGSDLRIVTIGNDNQSIKNDNCLNISITPADGGLIEGIIRQRYPKADYSDVSFINELSGGFPRIAVLATDNYSEGLPILKSVEDAVERILLGCGIRRVEQIRAIECLAMFKLLGADGNTSSEIDFVAENLARQTGDEMYEHLAHAAGQAIVEQRGDYFMVQLLPIASFLGKRRLDLLRVTKILNFIEQASPSLRTSFLSQWRYFDNSKTIAKVAQHLLKMGGLCCSIDGLNTDLGTQCLNAIVHVVPDDVADVVRHIYGNLSVDDLMRSVERKRDLLQVLEVLVCRKKTFRIAALLIMRLAATENKPLSDDATTLFKQLFQLGLSGTEAEPSDKFSILDQGLLSDDERVISVCVEALERTLRRDGFSRTSSVQVGSQPPIKDWAPNVWGEVFDFHRNGLQRLNNIRSQHKNFTLRCDRAIVSSIRSLLCENLFNDLEAVLLEAPVERGTWFEAIKVIGDWLYFERVRAPEDFSQRVRELYNSLLPNNLIDQAILYTKFYPADIHNPDLSYDRNDGSTKDFTYSSKKAKEVAAKVAVDEQILYQAIQTMVREDLNNVIPFTEELVARVEDPLEVFRLAVREYESSIEERGIKLIRGLLAGIDKRDAEAASQCILIAHQSESIQNQIANIYSAVSISTEILMAIVEKLRNGSISATECVYFSYGRGLDHLEAEGILLLVDELANNHEAKGIWASLEIIFMYQLNRDTLDRQIADRIRELVVSPKIFETIVSSIRGGHWFEQLILSIHNNYGIDAEFALGLSNQVIKLCQVKDHNIFFELDSYLQNIIRLVVDEQPIVLWTALSSFFEIATPSEVYYLKKLVSPSSQSLDLDEEAYSQEGVLFHLPEIEFLSWAKDNPPIRSPFLCLFYPIIEIDETGNGITWHRALDDLTHEFGTFEEFRLALELRLNPTSWSGSRVPHFERCLSLLEIWFDHPVPEMSVWARDLYYSLERQLERERDYE